MRRRSSWDYLNFRGLNLRGNACVPREKVFHWLLGVGDLALNRTIYNYSQREKEAICFCTFDEGDARFANNWFLLFLVETSRMKNLRTLHALFVFKIISFAQRSFAFTTLFLELTIRLLRLCASTCFWLYCSFFLIVQFTFLIHARRTKPIFFFIRHSR